MIMACLSRRGALAFCWCLALWLCRAAVLAGVRGLGVYMMQQTIFFVLRVACRCAWLTSWTFFFGRCCKTSDPWLSQTLPLKSISPARAQHKQGGGPLVFNPLPFCHLLPYRRKPRRGSSYNYPFFLSADRLIFYFV